MPSRPVGIYFLKRFVRDRAPFLADSGPPGAGALGGGGVLGGPGAEIPGGRKRNCRRHGGDEKPGSGIKRTLTYASVYIFNAHLLILLYVFAMLATSPATI